MPPRASLNPVFLPSREHSPSPWCLNVPPHLSPTGKAQRLFFPTKKAAALTALQLRNRQDNFGLSLSALSPARIAEASEAYNLLEDSGLSLLDAVRTGLSAHVARTA